MLGFNTLDSATQKSFLSLGLYLVDQFLLFLVSTASKEIWMWKLFTAAEALADIHRFRETSKDCLWGRREVAAAGNRPWNKNRILKCGRVEPCSVPKFGVFLTTIAFRHSFSNYKSSWHFKMYFSN